MDLIPGHSRQKPVGGPPPQSESATQARKKKYNATFIIPIIPMPLSLLIIGSQGAEVELGAQINVGGV